MKLKQGETLVAVPPAIPPQPLQADIQLQVESARSRPFLVETRVSNWTKLAAVGTVLLSVLSLAAVGLSAYVTYENRPKPHHSTTGSITKPILGYNEQVGDAKPIRNNSVCDISGVVRYLPPNNDLWLMELQYYRADGAGKTYDPNLVRYSPSDYPMTLNHGGTAKRTGYDGSWKYKFPGSPSCANPLFVGYANVTKVNRYAIFLVSMSSADSGIIRQYNVAKGKDTYSGIELPISARILDEIDVVQCPATLSDSACVSAAPR